jgi:uncharacterized phage protein (TIGR02218 family)
MSRVWFSNELETVATWWRVLRRDGVTLGFTTHDRDLWFDGTLHRATPGIVPSAIRRSADFEPDSAEVEGVLSHESITSADLAAGRFDGARVLIGVVDWDTGETHVLYRGAIGAVGQEAGKFTAALQSRKMELFRDSIPRTSPSCRAVFCGAGCGLSAEPFTHEAVLVAHDHDQNRVTVTSTARGPDLLGGSLRWLGGPHAGLAMNIVATDGLNLVLDTPLDPALVAGARALLREGCDRTLETCATRFANAVNFQGEPFLPGNDLVARYPSPSQ